MHGIGRRGRRRASGRCTAITSSDPTTLLGQSDAATAMKTAELEHQFSLTEKFEAQAWTKAGTGAALLAEAKNHEAENVVLWQLHTGAQWHVREVRYMRQHARVISVRSDVVISAAPCIIRPLIIRPLLS
jgi:hypothetical protein